MHLRENEHSTFEAQAIQKDQETANRMMKDKRRTAERKKSLCFTTRSRTSAPQLHNELNYVLCVRIGRSFCVTFCRHASYNHQNVHVQSRNIYSIVFV